MLFITPEGYHQHADMPIGEWFVGYKFEAAYNVWDDKTQLLHLLNYLSGEARNIFLEYCERRRQEAVDDASVAAFTYIYGHEVKANPSH